MNEIMNDMVQVETAQAHAELAAAKREADDLRRQLDERQRGQ